MVCPICDVESNNNHSCSNCNWEFIYFSEEPTYQQKIEYNEMMFLYAKNIAEFLIQQNEPYDFFVAKALTFKPDIDLYLALINFYVEKQEFDFALKLALESLKLTPCPMAYFAVAACYATLGQYTTALEYAKKAIEFDPTLPMDYIFGNIYRGLNQQNKAIEHYEKYLLLNPNDADIKKYIKDSKIQVNTSNKIQDDKIQKVNTVQVEEVAKKEEIIKLTPGILNKDMFENTLEYENRVNNLGYVLIGYGKFANYDSDKQILEVYINIDKELINYFDESVRKTLCVPSQKLKTKINQNNAKKLHTESSLKIISKIKMVNKKFTIIDILLNEHNFFNEYSPLLKEEEEEQRFKENFMKNIPKTWIDPFGVEWEIVLGEEKMTLVDALGKYRHGFYKNLDSYDWGIIDNYEESLLVSLKNCNTKESKYILEYINNKNEEIWLGLFHVTQYMGSDYVKGWSYSPKKGNLSCYMCCETDVKSLDSSKLNKVRRCRMTKINNNDKEKSSKSFFSKIFG